MYIKLEFLNASIRLQALVIEDSNNIIRQLMAHRSNEQETTEPATSCLCLSRYNWRAVSYKQLRTIL
jgi:hypothetical protein